MIAECMTWTGVAGEVISAVVTIAVVWIIFK